MKQKIYQFSSRPLVVLYVTSLIGLSTLSYIVFVLQGSRDKLVMFSMGLVLFFIGLGFLKLKLKPLRSLKVDCNFEKLNLRVMPLDVLNPQHECLVNFCGFQVVPNGKTYIEELKFQNEKQIRLNGPFSFELPVEHYQSDYKYYLVFFDFQTGRAITSFDISEIIDES